MNAKQEALYQHHKARIAREMDEAFETLLTQQLIQLKSEGVSKDIRKQYRDLCIVYHYETVQKVLNWLELEVRKNSTNIDECEVRIRTAAIDDLKETLSSPPLQKL